jgi:pyridoxamine 5'-phosphate oxidase
MARDETLDEISVRAWELLSEAPALRESPLRLGTLATVDADGAPRARTVVLRAAGVGWLEVYTDARSPKVAELQREPSAALCLYDPQRQLQLRLGGRISIHQGDEASAEAWRAAGIYARRDYLAPLAPGTPLDDPREGDPAEPDANQGSSENLAILRLEVDRLDWLALNRSGHRRAELRREEGTWSARWLQP